MHIKYYDKTTMFFAFLSTVVIQIEYVHSDKALTLLTPLYTSTTLGSSWGIGLPDASDITVPTSVCFSVILSIIMSARVRLEGAKQRQGVRHTK